MLHKFSISLVKFMARKQKNDVSTCTIELGINEQVKTTLKHPGDQPKQ